MVANAAELNLTPPPDDHQETAFLEAWKLSVKLTETTSLFGGARGDEEIERAPRKEALQPNIKEIDRRILHMPISRAALIAAMVSFYNPAEGHKLCNKIGIQGPGDLARALKQQQREAVAQLLTHYTGW